MELAHNRGLRAGAWERAVTTRLPLLEYVSDAEERWLQAETEEERLEIARETYEEVYRRTTEWAHSFVTELQLALSFLEFGKAELEESEDAVNELPILDSEGRPLVTEDGVYLWDYSGLNWVSPTIVFIDTDKLADLAVTEPKIAVASIDETHIGDAVITDALIAEAAIVTAKIDDAAIGDAQIDNVSVTKLRGGVITSDEIYIGAPELHLDGKQSRVEVSDLNATPRVRIGKLGEQATNYGIEIRDSAGELILSSQEGIAGDFGAFAYIDQITPENISTFFASGVIGKVHLQKASIKSAHIREASLQPATIAEAAIESAHIQDAAISTAKIADAHVTTIKIGQQQVTIPTGAINPNTVTSSFNWVNLVSITVSVQEAQPVWVIMGTTLRGGIPPRTPVPVAGPEIRILRNGSVVAGPGSSFGFEYKSLAIMDYLSPGSYSYTLQFWSNTFSQAHASHSTAVAIQLRR